MIAARINNQFLNRLCSLKVVFFFFVSSIDYISLISYQPTENWNWFWCCWLLLFFFGVCGLVGCLVVSFLVWYRNYVQLFQLVPSNWTITTDTLMFCFISKWLTPIYHLEYIFFFFFNKTPASWIKSKRRILMLKSNKNVWRIVIGIIWILKLSKNLLLSFWRYASKSGIRRILSSKLI